MTAQLWFFIIISLVIFNYLFSNLLDYINHRNWKDEIPNELKEFYNKEKYKNSSQKTNAKTKKACITVRYTEQGDMTVPYCTILYYTVLYCTLLYYNL